MANPVDFYGDSNNQQLYALDHLYGLPQFVKNAEAEEPGIISELPPNTFADVKSNLFPCHTKAATWLANAYFQLGRSTYHRKEATFIQDRITKFAAYWNISGLVDRFNKVYEKTARFSEENLPDEKFAMVMIDEQGNKIRRFPMPNPLSVKMAGEHLYANRAKYPYAWRKSAARRILKEAIYYNEKSKRGEKVASSLGATHFEPETIEYLERASGFGMSHPLRAAEGVARRAVMLKGSAFRDHQEKLAEIATALSETTETSPAALQKLAEIVDYVDREAGLHHYYHQGVDMPEEMFFDVLEKEAEEVLNSNITLTTGRTYPIEALANLPLGKIAEVMGEDFSNAIRGNDGFTIDFEKFAEIAPTLPRDDAALLERAIAQSLDEPMGKEARAALMSRESFSKEDLLNKFREEGHGVVDEDADYRLTVKI